MSVCRRFPSVFLAISLAAVAPLRSEDAATFSSPEHGFTIRFPGKLSMKKKAGLGRPGAATGSVEFLHVKDESIVFMVTCSEFADRFAQPMSKENLDVARERFRRGSKTELLREKAVRVGSAPARECWFQKNELLLHCLFCFRENRSYVVAVAAPKDEFPVPAAAAFIASFALTDATETP